MVRKILFGVLFLLMLAGRVMAAEKSYRIDNVNIGATVNSDGSMNVVENREYDFTGSYTFAYQYINRTGQRGEKYNLSDFKICDEKWCYLKLKEVGNSDTTKPINNFYVVEEPNRYYIKWFYTVNSIGKNFKLSYRVDNAVTLHQDIAEIYWKWIGGDWELSQNNVNVKVDLPKNIDGKEIQAWGHGPLAGVVSIGSNPSVLRTAPDPPTHVTF